MSHKLVDIYCLNKDVQHTFIRDSSGICLRHLLADFLTLNIHCKLQFVPSAVHARKQKYIYLETPMEETSRRALEEGSLSLPLCTLYILA